MKLVYSIIAVLGVVLGVGSPARAGDVYQVDPVHSTVIFRVQHLGVSYSYGRFNDPAGTINVDDSDLSKSGIEVSVDVAKIDTDNAKRDEHLKSPDFFNAKVYPTISFKSTSVKKTGEKTYEVAGGLTLRGVTKPVTLNVEWVGTGKDPWGGTRTGFETSLTIKRSDFGMDKMVGPIGDEVKLIISIEGVKK